MKLAGFVGITILATACGSSGAGANLGGTGMSSGGNTGSGASSGGASNSGTNGESGAIVGASTGAASGSASGTGSGASSGTVSGSSTGVSASGSTSGMASGNSTGSTSDAASDSSAGCVDGKTQCVKATPQTCTGGQWVSLAACAAGKPLCVNGACVAMAKIVTPGEQNTQSNEATWPLYPALLQTELGAGYTVQNNGDVNGAVIGCDPATMTKGGANPYTTDQPYKNSIAPPPDIVVIGPFGEHDQRMVDNDATLYNEMTYETNYDALVTDYLNLSSHPEIYMMTPIDLVWGGTGALPTGEDLVKDIMLPAALAVAQKHGLTVIDTYTAITPDGTVLDEYKGTDGQVNAAGQQKMVAMILAALGQ